MKNSQRGFIVPLLIAIIVVLVIGGGISFYLQQQKKQIAPDTDTYKPGSIQGTYKKTNSWIDVAELTGNKISIKGQAVWQGSSASSGQVNSGVIDGVVVLNGNKGVYDQNGCVIDLTFVQSGLTAKDNNQCGGLNVSFTGEYIRFQDSDTVVNTKVYSNKKYGFEIKYPSNFVIRNTANGINFVNSDRCVSEYEANLGDNYAPSECYSLGISVLGNKIVHESIDTIKTNVTVGGLVGEKNVTDDKSHFEMIVQVSKNNQWYVIIGSSNSADKKVLEEKVNQVISTFKFNTK